LIRLAYAADLPDPADLIRKLQDTWPSTSSGAGSQPPAPAPSGGRPVLVTSSGGGGPQRALVPAAVPQSTPVFSATLHTLQDVMTALEEANDMLLASQVYHFVHLVKLEHTAENGRLEIRLAPEAPARLSQDLGQALGRLTGVRWLVSISSSTGAPTLAQAHDHAQNAEIEAVRALPIMQEILSVFPDAEIKAILSTQK